MSFPRPSPIIVETIMGLKHVFFETSIALQLNIDTLANLCIETNMYLNVMDDPTDPKTCKPPWNPQGSSHGPPM